MNTSSNRRAIVAFALLASLLVVAVQPVGAVTNPRTASIHTTDTAFGNGTLTNAYVSGTGTAAFVQHPNNTTFDSAFAADDGGDVFPIGDDASNQDFGGELGFNNPPDRFSRITIFPSQAFGDGGPTCDISIADEAPDSDLSDGSTVFSGWTPSYTTGAQNIDLPSDYSTTATNISIQFQCTSDNDGVQDTLRIDTDDVIFPFSNDFVNGSKDSDGGYADIALTDPDTVGTYVSDNHTVDQPVDAFTHLDQLNNVSANVTWQAFSGGSWTDIRSDTYTTSGNKTVDISSSPSSTIRVNVTVTTTGPLPDARLLDEGVRFNASVPTVDNSSLSPNTTATSISGTPLTLSADINDSDFPLAQGDSLTVEFTVDGTVEGTDTLASNGTASISLSSVMGGTHDWNVTITDSYGHTRTSATAQFAAPANLTFRNESNPDEILSGITIDVTAYYNNETETRTVTDGNMSLSDFPVGETIIIRANTTDYYQRTVVLEDVLEQDDAYLLNRSIPTHLIRFDLEDASGDFPSEDTVLFVERDLNLSGVVEWRVIAGDNFGIQGTPAFLEQDERYRLRIKNLETGQVSIRGAYTAIQSETVTISVTGGVDPPVVERDYNWLVTENETAQEITFLYNDTNESTVEVKLTIHERFNDSNVLVDNETFTGSNDIFFTTSLTAEQVNTTWMAEIYVNRGDGFIHFREPVLGGQQSIIPVDLDEVWLQAIGVFVLLVVGTAFSAVNQGVGAISTSLIAGLMWLVGVFSGTATMVAIVMALGISAGFHYRYKTGVGA